MAVSYKKLWKMLIDKDMKKKDLAVLADVSSYTITKMSKGENVTTDTLGKICKVLECNVEDIMQYVDDEDTIAVKSIRPNGSDSRSNHAAK